MIAEVRMPLDDAEYSSSSKSDDVGSSSSYGGTAGKIVITQQINHDGEVNRARYMPSNATIIATKTVRVVCACVCELAHVWLTCGSRAGVARRVRVRLHQACLEAERQLLQPAAAAQGPHQGGLRPLVEPPQERLPALDLRRRQHLHVGHQRQQRRVGRLERTPKVHGPQQRGRGCRVALAAREHLCLGRRRPAAPPVRRRALSLSPSRNAYR